MHFKSFAQNIFLLHLYKTIQINLISIKLTYFYSQKLIIQIYI
jgi:hypothetical protein